MAIPYATKYELKQVNDKLKNVGGKLPDNIVGSITKSNIMPLPFVNPGETKDLTGLTIKINKNLSDEEMIKILSSLEYDTSEGNCNLLCLDNAEEAFLISVRKGESKPGKIDYIIAFLDNPSDVISFLYSSEDLISEGGPKKGWAIDCPDKINIPYSYINANTGAKIENIKYAQGDLYSQLEISESNIKKVLDIFYIEKEGPQKLYNFTNGKLDETREVKLNVLPNEVVGSKEIIAKEPLPFPTTKDIDVSGLHIKINKNMTKEELENILKKLSYIIDPDGSENDLYNIIFLATNSDNEVNAKLLSLTIMTNSAKSEFAITTVDQSYNYNVLYNTLTNVGVPTIGWQQDCPDEIIIPDNYFLKTKDTSKIDIKNLSLVKNILYISSTTTKLYNITDGKIDEDKQVEINVPVASNSSLGGVKIGRDLSITKSGTLGLNRVDIDVQNYIDTQKFSTYELNKIKELVNKNIFFYLFIASGDLFGNYPLFYAGHFNDDTSGTNIECATFFTFDNVGNRGTLNVNLETGEITTK